MQVRVLLRLRQAVHDGRALRAQRVLRAARPARAPPAELPVLPAGQGAARAADAAAGTRAGPAPWPAPPAELLVLPPSGRIRDDLLYLFSVMTLLLLERMLINSSRTCNK